MCHTRSLIVLSLFLLLQPLVSQARPPTPHPQPAAQATGPLSPLDALCADLSDFAIATQARQHQGWSVAQSLGDLAPVIAPLSQGLKDVYAAVVMFGHASASAPAIIRQSVQEVCRHDPKYRAMANDLTTYLRTRVDPYAQWVQWCRVVGAIAEQFVVARDRGIPLTTVLTDPIEMTPDAKRFVHDQAVAIYQWPHWDKAEARQKTETRCMADAPR